ncbi:MAG TPA: DUF1501 domain-containing protein [candidate division Zixibacteria bacterium]|nr:DUF1501 domain-containing protein [candidate division Zixibacteria bacterium]
MGLSRRRFLESAALGFIALGVPPAFLVRAAGARTRSSRKTLVIVFQRGGMDGLNAVVPFKDASYYALRPTIAIAEPARDGGDRALDLDGFFGLHPALAPLKPVYDDGRLAVVHAAGSPDNTRSHFDAQDFMELGTPGIKSTPDGWLNRYLRTRERTPSPLRAVAAVQRLPRILAGPARALTLSSIEQFRIREEALGIALERLYATSADPLLRHGAETLFQAMAELKTVASRIPPAAEAYPPGRFGAGLAQIARLIKADVGLEVAFVESEGWDTHVNQGGATGQMANRLKTFAEGLAAFCLDLRDRLDDVVLVTLSEFGRTARENGNRGTDHGHANAMFVLGGSIRGGRVYGRWPGLAPEQLYEERDLQLTTDYRTVCGELIARHLGQEDLSAIFPGFRFREVLGILAKT